MEQSTQQLLKDSIISWNLKATECTGVFGQGVAVVKSRATSLLLLNYGEYCQSLTTLSQT